MCDYKIIIEYKMLHKPCHKISSLDCILGVVELCP